jgi:hypothetical protein
MEKELTKTYGGLVSHLILFAVYLVTPSVLQAIKQGMFGCLTNNELCWYVNRAMYCPAKVGRHVDKRKTDLNKCSGYFIENKSYSRTKFLDLSIR